MRNSSTLLMPVFAGETILSKPSETAPQLNARRLPSPMESTAAAAAAAGHSTAGVIKYRHRESNTITGHTDGALPPRAQPIFAVYNTVHVR